VGHHRSARSLISLFFIELEQRDIPRTVPVVRLLVLGGAAGLSYKPRQRFSSSAKGPTSESGTDRGGAAREPSSDARRGVYGISAAAELVGMGTQMLRLYERRGLLEPALRRIRGLLDAGLNLAGIALVLDLETNNAQLRANNTQLNAEKEQHQWLQTAPIDQQKPRKPTSSTSTPHRPPRGDCRG